MPHPPKCLQRGVSHEWIGHPLLLLSSLLNGSTCGTASLTRRSPASPPRGPLTSSSWFPGPFTSLISTPFPCPACCSVAYGVTRRAAVAEDVAPITAPIPRSGAVAEHNQITVAPLGLCRSPLAGFWLWGALGASMSLWGWACCPPTPPPRLCPCFSLFCGYPEPESTAFTRYPLTCSCPVLA